MCEIKCVKDAGFESHVAILLVTGMLYKYQLWALLFKQYILCYEHSYNSHYQTDIEIPINGVHYSFHLYVWSKINK